TFTASDLINIDNYYCYLKMLISGQTADPFSMGTIAPVQGRQDIADKAIEFSRITYGKDRSVVTEAVNKKFEAVKKPKPSPRPKF
ncbi:MAG: hypothetical protein OXT67_06620, partial [Zetaproteobacteria bacterium]|nr:hypothetical protein [Zetaproteobacteria bacterium]